MTVPQIASLAANIGRTLGNQNSRAADAVSRLLTASGGGGNNSALASDVAALADATFLQSQVSSLRVASQNLAQAQSLLSVADSSTSQITDALNQLQDLSTQAASTTLSDSERKQLNIEFQQLRAQIDRIANSTQFNGQKLLDGSLDSNALGGGNTGASIGSLTTDQLFGNSNPDLLSAQNAQAASQTIASAQQYVQTQQANIGALQEGIDYAAANIESATQNQDAARSTLQDGDFTQVATESAQAQLQAQATASLLAQTNKLPGNLLALLTE